MNILDKGKDGVYLTKDNKGYLNYNMSIKNELPNTYYSCLCSIAISTL